MDWQRPTACRTCAWVVHCSKSRSKNNHGMQAQADEQAATHQQALRSVQEQLHARAKSLEEASANAKSEAAAHEADMAELNKALSAAKQDAVNANQQLDTLQTKACS